MKFAICIIAYNRVNALKRLVNSLLASVYPTSIDLIISIDKSKSTIVEEYARTVVWQYGDYKLVAHEKNLGLRKHILGCGAYLKEYDALVVLEDDIVVTPVFMYYVTQCVAKYKDDERIAGISLYGFNISYQTLYPFVPMKGEHDVYFMNCAQSWGQVWMKKQWLDFYKWYQNNNDSFSDLQHIPSVINNWPETSWLKYHTRYCIEEDKLFVYPYYSLSTNFSDVGAHVTEKNTFFQSNMTYCSSCRFKLRSLDEDIIEYDGFFEPKFLSVSLGVPIDELCVDLNGTKSPASYKRFLLTKAVLDYEIRKTFGLDFKPVELNILLQNPGNEIFLYDTSVIKVNNNNRPAKIDNYRFMYGSALDMSFRLLGVGPLFCYLIKSIVTKSINRLKRKKK